MDWPKKHLEYLVAFPAAAVVYFEFADRVGWSWAIGYGAVSAIAMVLMGLGARRNASKKAGRAPVEGDQAQGPAPLSNRGAIGQQAQQVTRIIVKDSPGAVVSLQGPALEVGRVAIDRVQNAPILAGATSDWSGLRPDIEPRGAVAPLDAQPPVVVEASAGSKELDRDREEGIAALLQAQDGRDREANATLGIRLLERALGRASNPLLRAKIKGNIANGWLLLAQVGDAPNRLVTALDLMYEASLAFEREPERLAESQLNMGSAYMHLATLREKEKNANLAINSLKRSIEGFEGLGLTEKASMARVNLGSAYKELAEVRETADNSHRAIEAYEAAKAGLPSTPQFMDRGMLENNLGTAYLQLSFVENRTANIGRALQCFGAALDAAPLEKYPIRWAMAHRNLGAAYRMLAEVSNHEKNAAEAIWHLTEALRVFDRKSAPVDFGHVHKLLALTHITRAQRVGTEEGLQEVLRHADLALLVLDRSTSPQDFASLQDARGAALEFMGVLKNQTALFEEAIGAFDQALEIRRLDLLPIDHAGSIHNRAIAKIELAIRTQSRGLLDGAISDLETALEIRSTGGAPHHLAATHLQLGKALLVLAAWGRDRKTLDTAIAHLEKAERMGKHAGDERIREISAQLLEGARTATRQGFGGSTSPAGYA